jgi:hypothetical protein
VVELVLESVPESVLKMLESVLELVQPVQQ